MNAFTRLTRARRKAGMNRTQSPFVTPLKSDYRAGFEAGLRRAQELAHRYAGLDFDEVGFDRDIDAEVKR